MNVERVAPFFEAFRDSLRASADRDEPRIGLLTPGAFSETYFEHATLARYLGFLLVEGDDLAVSGDRIHIRTVAGLKRLDVLLRRVDSNFLDPLELDASSHLGVPGLIDVLRKDGVVVANMPGSGVLEARALLGFLPSLCRRLLGENLMMPHIATWWCGQKAAREEVLSRLEDFAIEGAYGRAVPGFSSNGPVLAGELSPAERDRLQKRDRRSRHRLCRPGTGAAVDDAGVGAGPDHAAPVRAAGVCRGNARWLDHSARRLLPDCRTARCPRRLDGRRRAVGGCLGCLRQGGLGFDAAAGRRSRAHPAHRRRGPEPGRGQSVLARPLSRARRGDAAADPRARRADARSRQGIVDRAALGRAHPAASGDLGRDLAGDAVATPQRSSPRRCRAEDKFGSALSLAKSAQRTASSLRERLSPDAWQIITEMVERLALQVDDDDSVVSAAELTLQELASLAGLAQENMNRAAGWRFLDMGRRAERAINTARFARQFAYDEAGDEDLDVLLTLVDCQITYRSRYLVGPALAPVRDLAVLDPYNPRSVAFQVATLNDHIAACRA